MYFSYVKYLGVYIDEYLNWMTVKLVKANAMLSKLFLMKPFSDLSILLSSIPIYELLGVNPFFFSHFTEALRIACFAKFNGHTTQLFRKMKIMKFTDLVSNLHKHRQMFFL